MTSAEIGGRRVDISKEDNAIKVVFHPIAKGAKFPNAKVFTITLTKGDLDKLRKLL